jgi:hypothetical protein
VETNPPRNNRLRLIHTDEQPGAGIQLAPGPRQFHRAERSPCLRKLREAPTDTKLFLDKTDSRSSAAAEGPGKLRTSTGSKKPTVEQDQSRQTP